MTKAACVLALLLAATPAFAQFGALNKAIKGAEKAKKIADLNISDQEERQIGEQVSTKLRDRFGVYQDAKVTKYVSLVGAVVAHVSTRPGLDWQFIVLDTDGVNAYATPGGFIHVTRGLLGLVKNEAELAGVLGHEITHVTAKHTIRQLQKGQSVELGTQETGQHGLSGFVIGQLAQKSYDVIFEGAFSRDDELESDQVGIDLANRVGYAPNGMADLLNRIAERNTSRQEPNGLFASHPRIKERVDKIAATIKKNKLTATATVEARYKQHIAFDAKAAGDIAMVVEDAKGLTGGGGSEADKAAEKKEEEPKKEEPKKKGFGLGSLKLSGGSQAQNSQQTASAGAKGGVPDRDATGGPTKTKLNVTVTAAEIAEFKKGIA
jgi:predicted Zn-dependent protease